MSEQATEEITTAQPEEQEQPAAEQESSEPAAEATTEEKPNSDKEGEKPSEQQQEGDEGEAKPKEGGETAAAPEEEEEEEEEEEDDEPEEPEDGVPIVLVTGASGFIANHLVKLLLEQGRYRVRGTVRSKKREDKVKPLLDLVPDAKYPLRLVCADLSKPKSWAKAVNRCTYVFHVASPFLLNITDEAAIVKTAVEGTTNVLQACADAGTVKRVVVTSSVAAVSCGLTGDPEKPADYVYTEKDWSPEAACGAYEKSKMKAERAAWDFVKELDESKRFELVVVNPAYVQGPLLSAKSGEGSKEMCERILGNKMPALPDMTFSVVDVRDVAAAHIAAMEKSEAAGNRYILYNKLVHMRECAQIIGTEFRPQGYKVPSKNMPKALVWVGKLFVPSLKSIYSALGKRIQYSNERMVSDLGIEPRPVEESIIDLCYSLVDLGLVKKTPGYLGHPSTRPPPPEPAAEPLEEATSEQEGDKGTSVDPEGDQATATGKEEGGEATATDQEGGEATTTGQEEAATQDKQEETSESQPAADEGKKEEEQTS